MKYIRLRIIFLLSSFSAYAAGDMFQPRSGLPAEQLTEEVRLERLYDYLCASDDFEARERAENYYDENTYAFSSIYPYSQQYAAEEYLHIRGWQEHPEYYWIERGASPQAAEEKDYLDSIGHDLHNDAVHRNTIFKELHQAEQNEKELRENLIAIENGIKRKSSNAGWATLLICVALLVFLIGATIFTTSVRKLKRS